MASKKKSDNLELQELQQELKELKASSAASLARCKAQRTADKKAFRELKQDFQASRKASLAQREAKWAAQDNVKKIEHEAHVLGEEKVHLQSSLTDLRQAVISAILYARTIESVVFTSPVREGDLAYDEIIRLERRLTSEMTPEHRAFRGAMIRFEQLANPGEYLDATPF